MLWCSAEVFFQSLRCIRWLRLSTKRYQCLQCGSVLSVALLNRSLRFVYVCVYDTLPVTQCRRIFFFSSVSLLFIYSSYCSACSTLPQANRPLLVTRLIHTRHYRSATCDGSTMAAIAVTHRAPPTLQLHRSITGGSSNYDARFRRPTIQG